MYFNKVTSGTLLADFMEKHNKISSEMYKHLVQQKVQRKVHNNYVALLIKQPS